MKNIKIVITCVGGYFVYDFINSLKNQKDFKSTILGVDQNDSANGKMLCDHFFKISSPKNEKKYIADVIKIYKKYKFDLFFAGSDAESYVISKYQKYFKSKKVFFKSQCDQFHNTNLTYNKKIFFLFCQKEQIPVGKLNFFQKQAKLFQYLKRHNNKKFILKALKGSGTRNVFLINPKKTKPEKILESRPCYETNAKHLKKLLTLRASEYVLMPFYEDNTYDVDCIAINGKIKEIAIRKREFINKFMFYSVGHTMVKNKNIENLIKKFIKQTNYSGTCDFDVIKNNNNYLILDVGCRFSGSVDITIKSGINFPAQLVRYLIGIKPKKYKLNINKSFRAFLKFEEIDSKKNSIFSDNYVPHFTKQKKH